MSAKSPIPFVVDGIDHLLLLIDDMRAALNFYCNVLGCELKNELPEYAMAQLRAGSALIDLVDIETKQGAWARPKQRAGRNMDHVCLALGRHEESKLRAHLKRHGVDIVEEGVHEGARGESLSIYVKDPSGNTIELKGPP